ncbi:hypothetical protein CCR75_000370 [Bremia lactucae]|uniref:Uncharacterized protein n=1 Tax=Bremia lactucae TaxID=4779 RepID=A0A976FNV8_BRELC|nr:hypothetical protein CCR75_000370 [Bremia lactucae]
MCVGDGSIQSDQSHAFDTSFPSRQAPCKPFHAKVEIQSNAENSTHDNYVVFARPNDHKPQSVVYEISSRRLLIETHIFEPQANACNNIRIGAQKNSIDVLNRLTDKPMCQYFLDEE